jgi:hypothetical protein
LLASAIFRVAIELVRNDPNLLDGLATFRKNGAPGSAKQNQ